jgi:hypothetical protein
VKIYEKVTKYRSDNGKPYSTWEFKEYRCDFTGAVISEDENTDSYPHYKLDYAEQDPCFGSGGDEYDFGKKFKINVYEFLSGTYHFITIEQNACFDMMKHLIDYKMDFADMCRYSRIKTACKLIGDELIESEQLYDH